MTTPINHVSDTSIWVATYRAKENRRADALFHDPLAEKLVGVRGPEIVKQMRSSVHVEWTVIIRTVIIDEFITQAIANGADTVLNLGAGLDTRPYRMKLPKNLRWIEVDHSHIIELKEKALINEKPVCQLERVKLDLADLDLRRKFFSEINSSSKKVLVLTEGVIPYLTTDEAASLAKDLRAQKNFSIWIVDYLSPKLMTYLRKKRTLKQDLKNAPFKFQPKNWEEFYSNLGWNIKEVKYLAIEANRVGRAFPFRWWEKFMMKFAPAKKIAEFQRMSGYAILQ